MQINKETIMLNTHRNTYIYINSLSLPLSDVNFPLREVFCKYIGTVRVNKKLSEIYN